MCVGKINKHVQIRFSSSNTSVTAPATMAERKVNPAGFDLVYFTSQLETWYIRSARISFEITPSNPNPTNVLQDTIIWNFRTALHVHSVNDVFEEPEIENPSAYFGRNELILAFNKYNQVIEFPLNTVVASGINGWEYRIYMETLLRTSVNAGITNFSIQFFLDFELYQL